MNIAETLAVKAARHIIVRAQAEIRADTEALLALRPDPIADAACADATETARRRLDELEQLLAQAEADGLEQAADLFHEAADWQRDQLELLTS